MRRGTLSPHNMRPVNTSRVGLIAGQGRLPIIVAEGMRRSGHRVMGLGLMGQFDPAVPGLCDGFVQAPALRIGEWVRKLRRMGVSEAVMVGRVDKAAMMHDRWRLVRQLPDWTSIRLWYGRLRHDHRSPALLAALADTLEQGGVRLIDSTTHIPDHLAAEGVMTRRAPTAGELADIRLGWPILREALRWGVGQSIAVRELDVLAVEAVEGTDRMIERAGTLCRGRPWVLLKGASEDHDRRADVPTIGVETIRNLHGAGARCLALAAGDVILVDKPATLAEADRLGLAIIGVGRAGPG